MNQAKCRGMLYRYSPTDTIQFICNCSLLSDGHLCKAQSQIQKSLLPQEISLRHPPYDLSTTLRCSSEQPIDFTMHSHGHRESAYARGNRSNTLPNTYPELAESITSVQAPVIWQLAYHLVIYLDTEAADLVLMELAKALKFGYFDSWVFSPVRSSCWVLKDGGRLKSQRTVVG